MKFLLLDQIVHRETERIVARKQVSLAEEYLQDHFPGYPVLPGVLMLETMVQAARELLAERAGVRLVLGGVRALKYGAMVRPGDALEVEVKVLKPREDGSFDCRGTGRVLRRTADGDATDETAVSGRFTMRPVRTALVEPHAGLDITQERDPHGHEP